MLRYPRKAAKVPAAMTFVALLLVLLAPDDSISFGILDSGWFPLPRLSEPGMQPYGYTFGNSAGA
jgi:hypothetical protein